MRGATRFLLGPAVGLGLLIMAVVLGFGPGFLTLAAIGAVAFIFVTPLTQYILGRLSYFRNRSALASSIGLALVIVVLAAAITSGKFFFW